MTDFGTVRKNLEERGYAVRAFETKEAAAVWLNETIDGTTVGFGGSGTLKAMGLFESLSSHNTVYWHWVQDPDTARAAAMTTEVYLCSANALAKTGEIVNIDGLGNRVASTLFGHRRVIFVIGRNKLAADYDGALFRARNVAAPKRAQQMGRKTPCAALADHCYDCRSPERVCRGLTVLWGPMMGSRAEVVLIDEDLGN